MTLFDLLFLVLVPVAAITLIAALLSALLGHAARSRTLLRRLGLCALAYLAVVAMVGFFSPQRVLRIGDPWCFDDWCLSVESVSRAPQPPRVAYTVALRIFSRARRVSQRALGAWVYVIDSQGRRYAPETDPSATPLDVRLRPGDSVSTTRTFRIPAGASGLGLITGHGGPFDLGKVIIGDEASLFHKLTYIRLQ